MNERGFHMKKVLALALAVLMISGAFGALAEELPDTYTHATDASSKEMLTGEALDAALQFLADSSHYLYINRATPYYGNYTQFPETGFDTEWRSPVNGRVYRGPYYDPICRSVNWLTTNPNGSINSSVGSYWVCIPPNTDLVLENNELQGYEKKDCWQIIAYMAPGQSVQNFINNGRGSFYIDAALLSNYGLQMGWEDRNILNVQVKLTKAVQRELTPQEYYDGELPTTSTWLVAGRWAAVPGWGPDAGEDQMRSIAQFWGCATGDEAALNLNTDEERAAYIERANNDPAVMEALTGCINYMHFEITQVLNIVQECGFDFEQASGKVNGIDMDHDGFLDRDENGELILQNYENHVLPEFAYELDQNLGWWYDGTNIIDEHGQKIVGANEDGTPILSDGTEEEAEETVTYELADNEFVGTANGKMGPITVKVTVDNDTITAIEVLEHSETSGYYERGLEVVDAIIAANSTDVDTISSATYTSKGIIDAVNDALK